MGVEKIMRSVDISTFQSLVFARKNNIVLSPHAINVLSNSQRKLLDATQLISQLLHETPRGVGLQTNGNYSVYYRRKEGFIRMILSITHSKITIVTFTVPQTMPNLERI